VNGTFVSLCGTPISQRAIQPRNLVKRGTNGLIYGRFLTLREIPAIMGPIAPYYNQSGNGIQYILANDTSYLVDNGALHLVTQT
jgi:hypothetical protein